MATIFGVSRRTLWAEVQQLRAEVNQLRVIIGAEVQQLCEKMQPATEEVGAIRLKRMLDTMHKVTHLQINAELPAARAIAEGLQSVMKPLPYGVAGGRARARHAWRYDDGSFMSYDAAEQIQIEARERMARGGRARARGARRTADGRFL